MSPSEFHSELAPHLGEEYNERAVLCRATVERIPEILFLVHVHMRQLSLAIDRISDGEEEDRRRSAYRRIARSVADEMRALDRGLQHFRTGPLMRLVLQGPAGAVFADSVLMDEFVMATIGPAGGGAEHHLALPRIEGVRRADRAVSQLVDQIRDLVGQPSQNLGGWQTNSLIEPTSLPPDEEPVPHPHAAPNDFRRAAVVPPQDIRELLLRADSEHSLAHCRKAVLDGSLHYIAMFRGMEQLLEVDAFEGREVKQFLTRLAPQTRRELYREFGREAEIQVAELARHSGAATGSPLLRVVFDVEQGAIFYYRVGEDRHLIGVTLNQRAVSQGDDAAGNLALTCR